MSDTQTPTPPAVPQPMLTPRFDTSMADLIERRVAASAVSVQAQFLAVTKLIDQRVDGNKEQTDRRLDALDKLSEARTDTVKNLTEALIRGARERSDERWDGWKAQTSARDLQIETAAEKRSEEVRAQAAAGREELRILIFARMEAQENARVVHNREIDRRLDQLNHANDRIAASNETYVRRDIYEKDMERIYSERRDQLASAEQARISNDASQATNRRNTILTMMTAAISLIAVLTGVLLHFGPNATP